VIRLVLFEHLLLAFHNAKAGCFTALIHESTLLVTTPALAALFPALTSSDNQNILFDLTVGVVYDLGTLPDLEFESQTLLQLSEKILHFFFFEGASAPLS
jgi:hypothetical protein